MATHFFLFRTLGPSFCLSLFSSFASFLSLSRSLFLSLFYTIHCERYQPSFHSFVSPRHSSLSPSFHSILFLSPSLRNLQKWKYFSLASFSSSSSRARTSQSRALTTISSSMPFDPRREEKSLSFFRPYFLSLFSYLRLLSEHFSEFFRLLEIPKFRRKILLEKKKRKGKLLSLQLKEWKRRGGKPKERLPSCHGLSFTLFFSLTPFLVWSSILVLTPHLPLSGFEVNYRWKSRMSFYIASCLITKNIQYDSRRYDHWSIV